MVWAESSMLIHEVRMLLKKIGLTEDEVDRLIAGIGEELRAGRLESVEKQIEFLKEELTKRKHGGNLQGIVQGVIASGIFDILKTTVVTLVGGDTKDSHTAWRRGAVPAGSSYFDYLYKFPKTQAALAQVLCFFEALRAAHLFGPGNHPTNMLGTPRNSRGEPDNTIHAAWRGDPGFAATSWRDPATGQLVETPARGNPAFYYIAIRSETSPMDIEAAGIDPADYGLMFCTAEESSAVLGRVA